MSAIPETSLSSPLLDASYDQFFRALGNPQSSEPPEIRKLVVKLRRQFPELPSHGIQRHRPEQTPELSNIGSLTDLPSRNISAICLSDSSAFLAKYFASLQQGVKDLGPTVQLPPMRSSVPITNTTIRAYQDAFFWQNLVETCVRASQKQAWIEMNGHYCSRRFALINHQGQYLLLTYDVLLMFKDMMYSRFIVTILGVLDPERPNVCAHMHAFIGICEGMLHDYGNEAYDLIKSVETLCKVQIIKRHETWLDGTRQANEMFNKYVAREVKLGGTGSHIRSLWSFISALPTTQDISEVFGLSKFLGHPYVDPRRGCRKVQDIVHSEQHRDPAMCTNIGYSFCHMYTRGYLKKTGKWPPLTFRRPTNGRPTRLESLYVAHHPTLAFGFTQYTASDWEYATFQKHLSYDYGDDILRLMADKALSHPRSCFDSTWNGKLDYKPPRPTGTKRVLERLLVQEDLDMKEVTTRVQNRDIPTDWKIVSVCPKERELKLEPRMFSKMVLEMRSFFVLAEENIKKGVFGYIQEQTMNLNRQELISRFLSVTANKGDRWVKLFVEIDFSSWNLHFDEMNTDPVAFRLNEIYGTPNLFTTIHRFFRECIIVMDNSDYPPEGLTEVVREAVMNGEMYLDTVWGDHACGFEGIAQKLWTLVTIAIGHQAVKDLGVPFVQNGQADNQVYAFDVYVPDSVSDAQVKTYTQSLEASILERLNAVARQVGHEIKPEECICSTCYFSYGKEMYINGIYTTTLAKALCRIFPATTADAPSTFELISSISGGGTAATEKSNVSVVCMLVTKFIEHLTISREFKRSLLHHDKLLCLLARQAHNDTTVARSLINLLCIIPGNLGGLPVSSCLEYLYRGHSDPVASSLAGLVLLSSFDGVKEYLHVVDSGWIFKDTPEIRGLIQDPYALPIDAAPPASSRISRLVTPVLLDVLRNKSLSALREVQDSNSYETFATWAATTRPLYPKVIHDLYKSSIMGVVDTLARRFTNTRTLLHMTMQSGINITGISIAADYTYLTSVFSRVSMVLRCERQIGAWSHRGNQYFTLQKWRRKWGLGDLEGVTNVHPLASGTLLWIPTDYRLLTKNNEIVVVSETTPSEVCPTERGPVVPYLGSKTSDKTVGKWIKPIDSSPPLRDLMKIMTIQSMMSLPNTPFWNAMDAIARTRTDIDLRVVRSLCRDKVGGTNAHRYQTRDDPRGSFVNVSTNWPSHVTVSSNWAGELGKEDYPFDFQEAITCLLGLLSWTCVGQHHKPPFGLVLQVDLSCTAPISDHVLASGNLELPPTIDYSSYYLTVSTIHVSSRAMDSAVLVNVESIDGLDRSPGSIRCALIALLLEQASGRLQQGNKYGRVRGSVSYSRILDLSELQALSFGMFVRAVTQAVQLRVAYRVVATCQEQHRPAPDLYEKYVDTELRRFVPSLYGSAREITIDAPTRGYGLGDPASGKDLVVLMALVRKQCAEPLTEFPIELYLRGSASVSRGLFSLCAYTAMRCVVTLGTPDYKSCKVIYFLLRSISNLPEELTRIRHLVALTTVLMVPELVSTVLESAEEVLRRLRSGPRRVDRGTHFPTYISILAMNPILRFPKGSVLPIERAMDFAQPSVSSTDVIRAWRNTPLGVHAGGFRWAPLRSTLRRIISSVLVIGIGDGTICMSFNPEWSVTGVELGSTLSSLGQKMIDYVPPYAPVQFTLHPISWTFGGDILNPLVLSTIVEECTLGAYDLVVIDVDRVSPQERLAVRQTIAKTGVPTYCRVLINTNQHDAVEKSFHLTREKSDCFWWTHNYPTCEFIVGSGPAPLVLYTSDTDYQDILPVCPTLEPAVRPDEFLQDADIQQYYLDLTGNFGNTSKTLSIKDCRALTAYMPRRVESLTDLLLHLMKVRCPRKRIRALYVLTTLQLVL